MGNDAPRLAFKIGDHLFVTHINQQRVEERRVAAGHKNLHGAGIVTVTAVENRLMISVAYNKAIDRASDRAMA
jgi:hypothetical protein